MKFDYELGVRNYVLAAVSSPYQTRQEHFLDRPAVVIQTCGHLKQ